MARIIARGFLSRLKQTVEAAAERPKGRQRRLVQKKVKPITAELRRITRDLSRLIAPRKKRQRIIDEQTADTFEHFLARRKHRHRHAG